MVLSIVGGGFVIGICMVVEWFFFKEIGLVEGIYGGWGNFGFVGVVFIFLIIAVWLIFGLGDVLNWWVLIVLIGIIVVFYGVFYFFNVLDIFFGKIY